MWASDSDVAATTITISTPAWLWLFKSKSTQTSRKQPTACLLSDTNVMPASSLSTPMIQTPFNPHDEIDVKRRRQESKRDTRTKRKRTNDP